MRQVGEDRLSAFLGKNWNGQCRLWHLCLKFSCIPHSPGPQSPPLPDVIFFLVLCNSDKVKQGSWASCWLHVNCFIFKVNLALKIHLFKLSPLLMRTELVFLVPREEYTWPVLHAHATHLQVSTPWFDTQVFNFHQRQIFLSVNWFYKYRVLIKGIMGWQIL